MSDQGPTVVDKPEETTQSEENKEPGGDDDDEEITIDIAQRLKELNIQWEDIFPPEILNWDKELPEDKKGLEFTFKLIKSEPLDNPNNLAEDVRKVAIDFMSEHVPVEHHARAKAAVEYLLRVCPLNQENKERYESMAIFEVWLSYFDEYLLATNTVEECKRWIELMRDIDWNELLWDQERKDTPMENCFDVVWKRFQKAAILDQRQFLAKSVEAMVESLQKCVEEPEYVHHQEEDKFIEWRWKCLNFDIQWVVIDICLGLKWEQDFFDSGRHKPLRRRGERFLTFLHDLYFFELDYSRKRPKWSLMGYLREARDFISAPMDMKGVIDIMQDRLEYLEWELNKQITDYFGDDEYLAYNACARRFITESIGYYKQTNKIDQE